MPSHKRNTKYGGESDARIWPADNPTVSKPRGRRKDTKRWCRGKVGVEHQPEIVPGQYYHFRSQPVCRPYTEREMRWGRERFWRCEHEERCAMCGKKLRWSWDLSVNDCPDYRLAQMKKRP